MEANAYSKYALKDLHQSIDLIDRKIAHSAKGEVILGTTNQYYFCQTTKGTSASGKTAGQATAQTRTQTREAEFCARLAIRESRPDDRGRIPIPVVLRDGNCLV